MGERAERVRPEFTTPAELAERMGCNERYLRKLAREVGACSVIGRRMILMPEDIALILKASRPNMTPESVREWLTHDEHELYMEKEAQEWRRPTGVVYFALREDEDNEIKIGFSVELERRLREFRTATRHPLSVALTIAARPELEFYFHEKFAKHRIELEWFHYRAEIRDFIARRRFTLRGGR